jgi:aarF domain-containing kinase
MPSPWSWLHRLPAAADETAAQQQAWLDAAHTRNAARLKAVLFANRGIYIKLGQHMGLLDYMLPPQYVSAMRGCFDEAPTSPWSAVRGVFLQDHGGKSPDELFSSFDRSPIASASLAQVHVATLNGEKVAVKVQHTGLQSMARAEIALLEQLLRVVHYVLPDADLQWLVDEVKFNLPRELDFNHEARNADRARTSLERFGDRVVVPRVHSELSTSRILVMDFEPGVQISDKAMIEGHCGLDPREVARLMSEVFCEMVFINGFVHCDPHPGNLLVRSTTSPSGLKQPQLVLLDHGLYRDVDESIRLHYCELWKGIVMADEIAIQRASKGLGVHSAMMEALYPGREGGVSHTLLAAMLTQKGWNHIMDKDLSSLELPMPKLLVSPQQQQQQQQQQRQRPQPQPQPQPQPHGDDAGTAAEAYEAELRMNVVEYLPGIMEVLQTVDRSVLLLLKTNDCLRSANARLGGRATETYIVTAEYCLKALSLNGPPRQIGGGGTIEPGWQWRLGLWQASARISAFRAVRWWQEVSVLTNDGNRAADKEHLSLQDKHQRELKAVSLGLPADSSWARIATEMGLPRGQQ